MLCRNTVGLRRSFHCFCHTVEIAMCKCFQVMWNPTFFWEKLDFFSYPSTPYSFTGRELHTTHWSPTGKAVRISPEGSYSHGAVWLLHGSVTWEWIQLPNRTEVIHSECKIWHFLITVFFNPAVNTGASRVIMLPERFYCVLLGCIKLSALYALKRQI